MTLFLSAVGVHAQSIFDVHRETLPNGIEVWIKPRQETRAVEVRVVVKVGFRYETARDSGLSHLLEHMLFKGTRRRSESELKWAIEGKGGSRNGYTTADACYYTVNILDQHFDFAVEWLHEILFESLLNSEDLEEARRDLYSEQQGDYPRLIEKIFLTGLFQPAPLRAIDLAFPHARVPERLVSNVDHIDRDAMVRHYRTFYGPENMAVIIVGNVDASSALRKVADLFGSLPAAPASEATYLEYRSPRPLPAEVRAIWMPPVGEMTHLWYGFFTRGREDPDRFALRVMAEHFDRRLKEEIRYKRSLAYTVYATVEEIRDAGVFYGFASVRRNREDEAKRIMRELAGELRDHELDPVDLEEAKDAYRGWAARFYENNFRLADLYQEMILSSSPERLVDPFEAIDRVTAGQIQRIARDRFAPGRAGFAIGRPPLTYGEAVVVSLFAAVAVVVLLVAALRRRAARRGMRTGSTEVMLPR